MRKVIPIKDPGPPVKAVLQDVKKESPEFRSVLVVAVLKSGEIVSWASGRLEDICASAMMADELAKSKIYGERT
jgi:hypothetical protein